MGTRHQDTASPPGIVHRRRSTPTRPWQLRLGFWLLIGIAAFFLVTEHRAYLVTGVRWLPMLLLLACPLIHMFGHGGHGGHRKRGRDAAGDSPPAALDHHTPAEPKKTRLHSHGGDLP